MKDERTLAHEQLLAGTDLARINRFTFLVAVAWGFFMLTHALAGRYVLAALTGSAFVISSLGVAVAFSKFAWRDRVSLPLVAGGSLVALVTIAVVTGGSDAPAMGFISLVPLVSGLYRRRTERASADCAEPFSDRSDGGAAVGADPGPRSHRAGDAAHRRVRILCVR